MRIKEITQALWFYDYLSILRQYKHIGINTSFVLSKCYAIQAGSKKFALRIFPYSLLCDHIVWWWDNPSALEYIRETFYLIYAGGPSRNNKLSIYYRYLQLPRCLIAQVLERNRILVDLYKRYASRFISYKVYLAYIIIRQLQDDLADYKVDASLCKPSFAVCNGVSRTRMVLKQMKHKFRINQSLPLVLQKHLLFYLVGV